MNGLVERIVMERIEELVQEHGLPMVLNAVAAIARERCHRIVNNGGAGKDALRWMRVATSVYTAAEEYLEMERTLR